MLLIEKDMRQMSSVEKLCDAVSQVLRQSAVRSFPNRWSFRTIEEEVFLALNKAMKGGFKILKLIQIFGGSKMTGRASSHNAVLLEKAGRLVVDFVHCRVSVKRLKLRYYKCYGFGYYNLQQ